jgi:hypothetical protein
MSKSNILKTEHLPNGRTRITFDADDGHRIYEFKGSSVKALKRGTDPGQLKGKLVEHKKSE